MINQHNHIFLISILILFGLSNCSGGNDQDNPKPELPKEPPFSGTIFVDPDIILPDDPTALIEVVAAGQGVRTVFDRRVDDWTEINAYLFNASFEDGLTFEIQVNPEFGSLVTALEEANKYAQVIGQLPTALREDVKTVTIHLGTKPFGGGNNNLLIHTGQSADYESEGILEETLIHESSHTSLDSKISNSAGWKSSQESDNWFISTYAEEFPLREDVAESFLLYFAFRIRRDRISNELAETIQQTMPNRIVFFDQQSFNMFPQEN